MTLVFLGDIGGTNIRYQLVQITETSSIIIKSEEYLAAKYKKSLIPSMQMFLQGEETPLIGVVGITGVVKNHKLIISYSYEMGLDNAEISEATGIPDVYILNDLEAYGYGISSLKEDEVVNINHGVTNTGNKVCIAIGTGLGQSYIVEFENTTKVFASEGGFQDYCPKSSEEVSLYEYMSKNHNRVELYYGYLITGVSSNVLYSFLSEKYPDLVDSDFDSEFKNSGREKTKIMMQAGFAKTNQLAVRAVEMWQKILGNMIGNVACNFLPEGGIYVGGGVVSKNFEGLLESDNIISGYYSGKPSFMKEALSQIPVYLIKPDGLGIRGALEYSRQVLRNRLNR
jgi:glucokinase